MLPGPLHSSYAIRTSTHPVYAKARLPSRDAEARRIKRRLDHQMPGDLAPTTESSCASAASPRRGRLDCLDLAQYRNYAGAPGRQRHENMVCLAAGWCGADARGREPRQNARADGASYPTRKSASSCLSRRSHRRDGRLVASTLPRASPELFVENLTGASAVVGTGTRQFPGDGHTILFVTNDFAVAPTV